MTLLFPNSLKGQFVTIPDPNFASFLTNFGYAPAMSGNQLDTSHPLVTGATSMNCSGKNILNLSGIEHFTSLQQLDCSNNPLSTLPILTPTLLALDISSCDFVILPIFPSNLEILNFSYNQVTLISNLPSSINELYCTHNLLTSLPPLPSLLLVLYCGHNQLTSLPNLPGSLNTLVCDTNQLTSLPTLPNSLLTLYCPYNNLTALPNLPASLDELNCDENPITSLPNLPNLLTLSIDNTLITTLPSLPSNLYWFSCSFTPLTLLPPLGGLENLEANYTALTSLPELPSVMDNLLINNNTSLTCLPRLNTINQLSFTGTPIVCLPNYGSVTSSSPSLALLPLCDMFNVNSCAFYDNISGQLYSDNNLNCVKNINEESIGGLKINLYQSGSLLQQSYTSQQGLYSIEIPTGTYTYAPDTTNVPFLVNCPPTGFQTSVITAVDSIDVNMDFGLKCKPGIDLGTVAINKGSGQFFPGDTATVNFVAGDITKQYNLNCAAGTSGTVTVYFSGPIEYAGNAPGSLVPSVTPNSLIYTIADFGSIDLYSSFVCYFATDTTAQGGDQLCITVETVPVSADLNPMNNMYTHCFTVINSYDPNVKEANPIGFTTPDNWITYTIQFQNTGTAPAQHIVITDTLDTDVQEGTFTFLASSHQPFINVTGNVIKFTFPNINLPDSTSNEPGSHGWVQYKVKSDPGLALGTTIENTANIYFDFNPPVITNTTVNTVVLPTGVYDLNDDSFEIFPNPAGDVINIVTMNDQYRTLNIYDISGRKVLTSKINAGRNHQIDINHLINGTYIAEIFTDNGISIKNILIKL